MWPFTRSKTYAVELFIGASGKWYWRLRHENTEILATSEAYSAREKAEKTGKTFADAVRLTYRVI